MSAGALDRAVELGGTTLPIVARPADEADRTPGASGSALYRFSMVVTGVLVLLWFAASAGLRPLMLPDEGRYVGVAWEMLRSGDWLTPTLDGLPYFHKPPLFYWITASSLELFGAHEWAARAAPILGATLATMTLYGFARRWAGERQARATLVALLAQPLFFLGGQFANLDMLVAGCISATIVLLAHATLCAEHGRPARTVLAAAYVMAALGVLAKGLIGVVLPALVIVAWLVARGRPRALVRLWSWPGFALFVLAAAPWFAAMQVRFPEFLDYFFVVQHFKRFAAAGFNNVQPFWFYAAVLALCCLPWAPWLLRDEVAAHRQRRPPGDPAVDGGVDRRGGAVLFLAGLQAGRLRAAGGAAARLPARRCLRSRFPDTGRAPSLGVRSRAGNGRERHGRRVAVDASIAVVPRPRHGLARAVPCRRDGGDARAIRLRPALLRRPARSRAGGRPVVELRD